MTETPLLIGVLHNDGRKAFHQRGQFPNWTRCGRQVERWVTAAEAIASDATPCRRCFPYDPIETWLTNA